MTADSVISMGARWTVITGDNAEALPSIPDCSVDAIVTDPPAGIAFMGKEWDHHKGGRDAWIAWLRGVMAECLRVLKPGGHALIWAIPRTSHWTMTAVEDAGFEIRDCVYHAFGQGFPKSHSVEKAIGEGSPEAAQWEGWGTALKPAVEPWILARKPLDGTVAANVLRHGTGAINIDGCRVGTSKDVPASLPKDVPAQLCKGAERNRSPDASGFNPNIGRFPAHLTLSHNPDCREVGTRSVRRDLVESKSDASVNAFGEGLNGSRSIGSINETIPAWECSEGCAVAMLDAQSGDVGQLGPAVLSHYATMGYGGSSTGSARPARTDSGGASRFFAVFDGREDGSSTTINACGNANTGAASTSAGRSTASSEGNSRTGGFGSMSGAPFPLDGTSTTETETRSITGSRTSSACPPNSIETTTDESERTTSSPTELSADDASGARNTGRSNRSRTEQRERSKGTASNASETHCGSGGRRTASVITPTCGNTEGVERPSSRFFYTAKASRSDREEGLAGMPTGQRANIHPTVKPTDLMRWLVRLITPPGGIVLDPFTGSGSTGKAAALEGMRFIGVERSPEYADIARARIAHAYDFGTKLNRKKTPRPKRSEPVQLTIDGVNAAE